LFFGSKFYFILPFPLTLQGDGGGDGAGVAMLTASFNIDCTFSRQPFPLSSRSPFLPIRQVAVLMAEGDRNKFIANRIGKSGKQNCQHKRSISVILEKLF